jgi:hypothetical protein
MKVEDAAANLCFVDYPGNCTKQWIDLARAFKVSRLWSLGPKGDVKTANELPRAVDEYNALVVVTAENANLIPGTTSLTDFYHPQNTIYLFGPDDGDLSDKHLGGVIPHKLVYLPYGDLWAVQAAATVLHDRVLKEYELIKRWRKP